MSLNKTNILNVTIPIVVKSINETRGLLHVTFVPYCTLQYIHTPGPLTQYFAD